MDEAGPYFLAGARFTRYKDGAFNFGRSLCVQRNSTYDRIVAKHPLVAREEPEPAIAVRERWIWADDGWFSTLHEC